LPTSSKTSVSRRAASGLFYRIRTEVLPPHAADQAFE